MSVARHGLLYVALSASAALSASGAATAQGGAGGPERAASRAGPAAAAPSGAAPAGMVWIAGGEFVMGSQHGDADAPRHRVRVSGFWLDRTEVTNAQFAAFVAATGYVTDAERAPRPEDLPGVPAAALVAGSLVFRPPAGEVELDDALAWWQFVPGADWRHPDGPGSSLDGKDDHPVVHVSWRDASAYCEWAGKRLPTEAEWEYAARGGLVEATYVWGDEQAPDGAWPANIWQGDFPRRNDLRDGFRTTAPVRSFPANGYGLHEMSGNVWEWVADRYRPDGYRFGARRDGIRIDPPGPPTSHDPREPGADTRVLRGGSFLCSDAYCLGYQPGTRMKSSADTSLCHTGFRCARSR